MKLDQLYKRASKGKISLWQLEIEGEQFRTISGFSDGKKITSDWTLCKSKSYCTAAEQAVKQGKALHKKKLDSGMFENIKDIDKSTPFKPTLAKKYQDYKHKIDYSKGVYIQRKYDGVRCIIKYDGMWTRTGKQIISAPHIFNSLKKMFIQNPTLILDGELFAEKEECDFNKIISCVRKTKPNQEDLIESEEYIRYYIYDLPSCEEKYDIRKHNLEELKLPKCCILTKTYHIKNEDEVVEFYTQFIKEGYEGLIIRLNEKYQNKRSKYLLKYKEFHDKEFIIKDIIEGIGKLQNKAGTILCDIDGKEFNSSINGSHDYLKEIWDNRKQYIGKTATIKYFELTSDGIPRFPKVIQIAREWE